MVSNLDLRIHHIGYLVKNIDKATKEFVSLGYKIDTPRTYDDYRKVDILFLSKEGYCVELISPTCPESLVSGLMSKYKNSPYHICYETNDIETTSKHLSENGYTAIDAPTPAPAIGGCRVQFFANRYLGMIEIVEK